jgi:hypothetical protein
MAANSGSEGVPTGTLSQRITGNQAETESAATETALNFPSKPWIRTGAAVGRSGQHSSPIASQGVPPVAAFGAVEASELQQ